MAANYAYLFTDLLTNAVLAELPLKGVSFTQALNGAGTFAAQLPLGDSRVAALNPIDATAPGRTAIWVDRGGTLVWGGVLWLRRWNSDARMLELAGAEFGSFLKAGRLTTYKNYSGWEYCDSIRDMLAWDAARTGRNIGMGVSANSSGIAVATDALTVYGYELKTILDIINQLATLPNGVDYAVDVAYVSGVPTKTFNIGWPRRGRLLGDTGWVFEHPGNIVKYVWPEDATSMADTIWATGAGTGDAMLVVAGSDPSLLGAGFPLLEDVVAHKDIRDLGMLAAYANADVAIRNYPVVVPELYVRADMDPVLGSYIVGDDVRVRILDDRFVAPGLDQYNRIVDLTVKPGDDAPEEVILHLGAA